MVHFAPLAKIYNIIRTREYLDPNYNMHLNIYSKVLMLFLKL